MEKLQTGKHWRFQYQLKNNASAFILQIKNTVVLTGHKTLIITKASFNKQGKNERKGRHLISIMLSMSYSLLN